MKNKAAIFLFVFALLAARTAGAALEDFKEYSSGEKLGRGLADIVTCPVEIARTINVTSRVKGAGQGWTVGLIEGLGKAVVRLGAGIAEVLTFPFDWPKENKTPLVEPEYVWQSWDSEYVAD